ncbi:Alpha/beta hydrolase fold-1 protein [Plesiocystis pacifica SIR-1]|uniref:Alpha/beta hydrolase fold-1 protein n=1 Tax=Plesiocystis pacifica SIR-1 TaxID=391625 RepID=A6GFL3_9BACT|nr:Alpha/beta hydrolase fold-1 protein [Plesiocystis pacifica SIR-1]
MPYVRGVLFPETVADRPWQITVPGSRGGAIELAGALGPSGPAGVDTRDTLVLILHGLGGSADSTYVLSAAAAAAAAGHAYLRLSMRGAGDSGRDFYHAGLWADLAAVLGDPSLARFRRVFVVGFSLGGHVALHLACSPDPDPRVAGVVAICSPLDLLLNAHSFDAPSMWLYRRSIVGGLEDILARIEDGPRRNFHGIRAWDREVVVPRWGFEDENHYWTSQSIGPRLGETKRPFLYVAAEDDPIVPLETVRPHLERARAAQPELAQVAYVRRGGHVGFPASVDLGMGLGAGAGLMPQVLAWCEGRSGA